MNRLLNIIAYLILRVFIINDNILYINIKYYVFMYLYEIPTQHGAAESNLIVELVSSILFSFTF